MVMCYMPSAAFAEGDIDESTSANDGTALAASTATVIAMVGDDKCTDLAAAVNKAYNSTNHTIKLIADVTLDYQLNIVQNIPITLDLNGHKITNVEGLSSNYGLINIASNANLSIVGEAQGSAIVDTRNNSQGVNYAIPAIHVYGTLTVSGDALSISAGENQIAIKVDEDGEDKQGKLIVESGTFTSTQAIQNYCGISTINGGTFDGIVSNYAYKYGGYSAAGDLTINGGTFNGKVFSAQRNLSGWPEKSAKISINGGTFNGGIAEYYAQSMR